MVTLTVQMLMRQVYRQTLGCMRCGVTGSLLSVYYDVILVPALSSFLCNGKG